MKGEVMDKYGLGLNDSRNWEVYEWETKRTIAVYSREIGNYHVAKELCDLLNKNADKEV